MNKTQYQENRQNLMNEAQKLINDYGRDAGE